MTLHKLGISIAILAVAIVLLFSVRGLPGNPKTSELLTPKWVQNGPFELSPERGRFALTHAIMEEQSLFFPIDMAKFSLPDVGYSDGHYVSLFAPTLSFLTIPGYVIGKYFGSVQVGTFLNVTIFVLINFILIYILSRKFGAGTLASLIASFVFVFATPAFAYGVSLYQHHVTTTIILLSIYLYIASSTVFSTISIFFLWALAVTVDYPNAFIFLPIGIAAATRLIATKLEEKKIIIQIKIAHGLALLGIIIPMIFFFWFNSVSYGGPLNMLGSSSVAAVRDIDTSGKPITSSEEKNIVAPPPNVNTQEYEGISYFKTRSLINGLYIHLLSPDRGIITFTPILVVAVLGGYFVYKKNKSSAVLLSSIALTNLLLYSLWGDPWGGWAFGSRYLIPGYAILAIFLASILTKWHKNVLFLSLILILGTYSIFVNTAGALSSSANPPQVQVLELEKLSSKQERYSYDRNLYNLQVKKSTSFLYNTWAHRYMNSWQYFQIISTTLVSMFTVGLIGLYVSRKGDSS